MSKCFEERDEEVAFERCISLMANLIIKYGPKVLENRKKVIGGKTTDRC